MTSDGNHGGGSPNETETIIFGYIKNGNGFVKLDKEFKKHDPTYQNTIDQIDIVPTISMLLGLNIPYNNLGILI
jgi:phosphatidylinositol glycan class O